MCGIAGIISDYSPDIQAPHIERMINAMAHRGPDGKNIWINPKGTCALGHQRLSIIDLSPAAAQPMHFLDRYSIVYNGELYNYIELKKELQKSGYHFTTSSDTEVILAAYDCYKEKCLQYFDGMFAFAIWDEYEQKLFGARDRFGEKPFYYFRDKGRFLFASEMKAFWAVGVAKIPEPRMLLNYISFGQLQHPANKSSTFFEDIYSLAPAHYFYLHKNIFFTDVYWRLDKQQTIKISETDAIDHFQVLLQRSVTNRLRGDVEVGVGLSGGLDSASVLHFMQQIKPSKIHTFSAVFPGFEKDESNYIQLLHNRYDTSPHLIIPDAQTLSDSFDQLMYHQEEPFSSSSVFAQFCVYKMASQQGIKVLLEGQGADEILAGYHKYVHWYLQEKINRYKFSLASKERKQLAANQVFFKWDIRNWISAYLPSHVAIALEKRSFNKIIEHTDLTTDFLTNLKGKEWEGIHKPIVTKLNDILYFDVMEMGLESLLRFSDRNAMAHGCEVRLPFLHHELVSFVFFITF